MSAVQSHLDGSETPVDEFERVKPSTWLYNEDLDEWRLRLHIEDSSGWITPEEYAKENEQTWGNGDFTADDIAGHYWDVTISVSCDYRFRIPAYEKWTAKEIAEELRFDASPADSHVVHTEYREGKPIKYGELPEDFDPYGGERLFDVIERQRKERESE